MSTSVRDLPAWTHGYTKLRDRIESFPAPGLMRSVNEDGTDIELLGYWPENPWQIASDVNRLMLLGARNEKAAQALTDAGWHHEATLYLLAGQPEEVEQVVKLADTSVLFEAPMDHYDVVEVTDFDRPVARGRMHMGENYALISDPDLFSPADPETARRAILANFALAAYQHGLPWLLLVASEENASKLATGWSKATPIEVMMRTSA